MSFSKFTPNLQLEKQLSKLEENSEQNIISNYKRNYIKVESLLIYLFIVYLKEQNDLTDLKRKAYHRTNKAFNFQMYIPEMCSAFYRNT